MSFLNQKFWFSTQRFWCKEVLCVPSKKTKIFPRKYYIFNQLCCQFTSFLYSFCEGCPITNLCLFATYIAGFSLDYNIRWRVRFTKLVLGEQVAPSCSTCSLAPKQKFTLKEHRWYFCCPFPLGCARKDIGEGILSSWREHHVSLPRPPFPSVHYPIFEL